MLPPIRYLAWAARARVGVEYDLATSGVPSVPAADLATSVALDDRGAGGRFRERIAERYGRPVEEVALTLGTSGGLFAIASGLVDPGDDVVVEEPAYEPLVRVFEGRGARVRFVPRRRDEGYRLDPVQFAGAVGPSTRAVVVSNPHNPTGVLTPDAHLAQLAGELDRRGIVLVVDEVYRELQWFGTSARACGPNVVVTSSLTKCFGLGWARAGWILAPAAVLERTRWAEIHGAGELPTTVGAIGEAAFRCLSKLDQRARADIAEKRRRVDAFIATRAPRLVWTPPTPGALFGFVHVRGSKDMTSAIERGAEREHVIVVPGSFFGEADAFRLAWTCPLDRLDPGLERLGRVLDS